MGIYSSYILPGLTHWVCSQEDITRQRKKVVPLAEGRVLEVGIGSGLNLPLYNPERVSRVWGVDPMTELQDKAAELAAKVRFKVDLIGSYGEAIPLDRNSADTVLVTYTICSIPDIRRALKEMNRVLKPGGILVFLEHGRSPDRHVQVWQDRITPVWKKVSGGCHLNRPVSDLIRENGFTVRQLNTGYQSRLKIVSFNYWGVAVK